MAADPTRARQRHAQLAARAIDFRSYAHTLVSKEGPVTAKKTTSTVRVSERALVQRINRKLREKAEVMKIARGTQAESNLGRYYTIDLQRNYLIQDHLDPKTVGRELGVLAHYEYLAK
jgi:hypothetical protein